METLHELWETGQDIWATGDRWGRYLITLIFGSVITFCVMAMVISSTAPKAYIVTAWIISVFIYGTWRRPMIIALVSIFKKGRSFLQWLLTILGVMIVIGVAFAALDFTSYPGLAPLALLAIGGLIALGAGKMKIKMASTFLWIVLIVILIIILSTQRERLGINLTPMQKLKVQQGPYMEEGLLIKPLGTTLKQQVKTETTRKEEAGGAIVYMKTNCYHIDDFFITVPPHKRVLIDHIVGPSPMENRCSYNVMGDATPISGSPGEVIRRKFENNVPFPDMPPEAMVFSFIETQAHEYIKKEGGSLILENPLDKPIDLMISYNTKRDSPLDTRENERGWDGSTATFRATIF